MLVEKIEVVIYSSILDCMCHVERPKYLATGTKDKQYTKPKRAVL